MFRPAFLLALGLALAGLGRGTPASAADELPPRLTGTPFLRVWLGEDYGAAAVNWSVKQHPQNGFIYVANNFGVLEYDGAEWRLIALPNEGRGRTVTIDTRGRVWVAGDDICVLEPDARALLRPVSVVARLPEAHRGIGSVTFSTATPDGVLFANVQTLMFFPHEGAPHVVRTQERIVSLSPVGRGVLVAFQGGRVSRYEAGALVDVPRLFTAGQREEQSPRMLATRRAADGGWDLLHRTGLYAWTGAEPFAKLIARFGDDVIGDSQLVAATFLADGRIACATARSGLLVLDRTGKIQQRIAASEGFQVNRIEAMCEDREGGLWLAMRTGIARVQLESPFAVHGRTHGLQGSPRSLLRHEGELHVAHNEGFATRQPDGTFREQPGFRLGASRLLSLQGRLFVTSNTLREKLSDGTLRRLISRPFVPLIASRTNPAQFFGGMSNGIWHGAFEDEAVRLLGRLEAIPGPIDHLLDAGDGFLWAVSPTGGVWRADFRAGVRTAAPAREFTAADGVPPARRRDEIMMFELGGEVVVSCDAWMIRYDRTSQRFVPETRIVGLDARRVGARAASRDETGALWLRLGPPQRKMARLVPLAGDRWQLEELPSAPLAELIANGMYADSAANTLWIAGQGALVSLDLDWRSARPAAPLRVLVRRIETSRGEVLFGGARPPGETPLRPFAPEHNALRIAFAAPTYAPTYRGHAPTLYRTRLDGVDREWSEWSTAAVRGFTNLPYRDLVFRVQARDLAGRETEEATLRFAIAAPWWLTPIAWSGYGLLSVGALAALFGLRTRALRDRNETLETAVVARTQELHRRNLELARLHRLELDEKISAQLAEEKARLEVLRYQLNPHFLFNSLNSVCSQIMPDPTAARAMVIRIADFCRQTLHRPAGDESATTVDQELKMLRSYLDIEQARLGELLTIEIEADTGTENVRIPPFLLLPLVENAVKYGSATSVDRVGVKLQVSRDPNGALTFEIANTGEWLEDGSPFVPSTRIGLENLRQRLARYYPEAHELTTTAENGWVRVRVRLLQPMRDPTGSL